MVAVISIWIFIAVPLNFVGTIFGKNWIGKSASTSSNAPWRENQLPRQIPDKKWYLQRWVHVVLGGILPFGSIFIEMYFVFTSLYKYYYVYGFYAFGLCYSYHCYDLCNDCVDVFFAEFRRL